MGVLNALYRPSLALLTDLYQLTMAAGYVRAGMAEHEAVFHLHFRKNPFQGGFVVAAGLGMATEFIDRFRFDQEDVAYLKTLSGSDGKALFDDDFLERLAALRISCDIDAMPEGTVAFPHEPLVRVRGPLVECQLLETALLNLVNFQTLIATKAARIALAARGEPVLEMGLRRAQGIDGGLMASRAAYIGGCDATSNVLAGRLYGIPVRGTHAHSWVMSFDDELSAFKAYAEAMPNNCVFLVDTYDTIQGVKNAIEVGRLLRQRGQKLMGIRLDSGDLAFLSARAREMLDEAGFPDAAVIASNDLDERLIESLHEQGAKIAVWGVGTKLATAFDQPALGGVYKLSAIRRPGEAWQPRIKLSEQTAKVSTPGILQVRRFLSGQSAACDMIFDELHPPSGPAVVVDPLDPTRRKVLAEAAPSRDLLEPIFRAGRPAGERPTLTQTRARAREELERFHAGVRRFDNPHQYPVGLELGLYELKNRLVLEKRGLVGRVS